MSVVQAFKDKLILANNDLDKMKTLSSGKDLEALRLGRNIEMALDWMNAALQDQAITSLITQSERVDFLNIKAIYKFNLNQLNTNDAAADAAAAAAAADADAAEERNSWKNLSNKRFN